MSQPSVQEVSPNHARGTSESWMRAYRLARASETNAAVARSYLATVPAEIRDKLDNPKVALSYIRVDGVDLLEDYDNWRKNRPVTQAVRASTPTPTPIFEDALLATKEYLDKVGGVDAALKLIDFIQKLKNL